MSLKTACQKLQFISFLLLLSACTSNVSNHSNHSKSLGLAHSTQAVEIKPYTLSTDYKEHRQQQKLFHTVAGVIAYTDNGPHRQAANQVIVLIHGVPTSSWMYRKVIEDLSKDFRVIAVDLLGYGSSAKPAFIHSSDLSLVNPDSAYSNDAQADYISDLLQALDVKNYSLLFHDMGGLVAWRLLNRSIKNDDVAIDHLFVLNTIIGKPGFAHPKLKKGMMAKQFAKSYANRFSSAALVNSTFRNMGLTDDYKLSQEECLGYVIPLKEGSDSALYSFFTGLDHTLFANLARDIDALANYRGTVDVIWGARDKVLKVEQLGALEERLADSQLTLQILDEHSHFIAEENPLLVADTVRQRFRD